VTAPVRWRGTPPLHSGVQGYTRDPSLFSSPPPRVSNMAMVSTLFFWRFGRSTPRRPRCCCFGLAMLAECLRPCRYRERGRVSYNTSP